MLGSLASPPRNRITIGFEGTVALKRQVVHPTGSSTPGPCPVPFDPLPSLGGIALLQRRQPA